MAMLFLVLIIITCAVLAFFVLIQNPKGGGLAGSFGGYGNQMMGAKQSTDVVEKGTWVAASVLLALTLLSFILIPHGGNNLNEKLRSQKVNTPGMQAPQQQAPPAPVQQAAPAPAPANQEAPAGGQTTPAPAPNK